jgi:hypothetical protein
MSVRLHAAVPSMQMFEKDATSAFIPDKGTVKHP